MPATKKTFKTTEPFEKQLFYNTSIPARLWFLRRDRTQDETLFIDTYLNWRTCWSKTNARKQANNDLECAQSAGTYEDEKGFCKTASPEDIEKHNFILTPDRYVGIPDEKDDGVPYEEKLVKLSSKRSTQIQKETEPNAETKNQLSKVGITLKV